MALLTAITALVQRPDRLLDEALESRARSLAKELSAARYVAIVADGESDPDATPGSSDPQRAAGLIALAHALNAPTRCALSTLRGGGNRTGADAVVTAQTGYPMSVDFGLYSMIVGGGNSGFRSAPGRFCNAP